MAVDWSKPIETYGGKVYPSVHAEFVRCETGSTYPIKFKTKNNGDCSCTKDGDYQIGDGPIGSHYLDIRNVPEPAAEKPAKQTVRPVAIKWVIELDGGAVLTVDDTHPGPPAIWVEITSDSTLKLKGFGITPPEMRAIAAFLVEQADRMEGKNG